MKGHYKHSNDSTKAGSVHNHKSTKKDENDDNENDCEGLIDKSKDQEANTRSSQSLDNKNKNQDKKKQKKKFVPPRHEFVFVCVVCFAQLLTQAGLGQSIAPLPILGEFFDVKENSGVLSWLPAAYSLGAGTFILIAGRLGDMFGHKLMFVLGFSWFGMWSFIAGLSSYTKSVEFFIVCRFFQGIGPAFVLPSGVAILGQTYESNEQRKQVTFSAFAACAPSGFILGALFASLFAQLSSWEYAWYVMGIVCVIIAVLGYLLIPDHKKYDSQENASSEKSEEEEGRGKSQKESSDKSKKQGSDKSEKEGPGENKKESSQKDQKEDADNKKFDWLGSITGVSALVLTNIAFNQAPSVGWHRDYVIALIVIGLLLLVAFIYIELRIASAPLIPRLLFTREVAYVLGCISAGWSSFGIWMLYWWQFLENLRGQTPLLSTAQFTTVAISGALASTLTGFLLHFHVKSGILMVGSMCAFILGLILFALTPVNQTYWALTFVSLLVMPFGMDISFPAGNLVLSDSVPSHLQGAAASLVNTLLNYSISIGLGIAGTVEAHVNPSGKPLLEGYRAAIYTGIALAGTGVLISLVLVVDTAARPAKKDQDK